MKLKFDFNKIIGYFNLDSERGLFINSVRDWKVLLTCSALMLVLVFGVDIYTLLNTRKEMDMIMTAPGVKNSKDLKINEATLNSVLREIEAKAETFRKNSALYYAEPSSASTTTPVVR